MGALRTLQRMLWSIPTACGAEAWVSSTWQIPNGTGEACPPHRFPSLRGFVMKKNSKLASSQQCARSLVNSTYAIHAFQVKAVL